MQKMELCCWWEYGDKKTRIDEKKRNRKQKSARLLSGKGGEGGVGGDTQQVHY